MSDKIEVTVVTPSSIIKTIEEREASREASRERMAPHNVAFEAKVERPRRDEVKDHEYVVQTRRCLGCDNKFRSSWWGHRMCKKCR